MENSAWGGARQGAGRKAQENKLISVNLQLSKEDIGLIDMHNGKSRSAKLRQILEDYKNLKK